jgi:hypothetical protein
MKLSPFQLAAIAVGGFASVIMLNILASYKANDDFRGYLQSLKPSDVIPMRVRRVAEENMEAVPAVDSNDEGDDDGA